MPDAPWFIDASLFLGMHDADSQIRQACLSFFRRCFHQQVVMNLEQVGLCDGVIWQFPQSLQSDYYPFMDCLHSEMQILRQGYCYSELRLALDEQLDGQLDSLSPMQGMLAAQVIHQGGRLFTHDVQLRALPLLQGHIGHIPMLDTQSRFPDHLETLYQHSKTLVVTQKDGIYALPGHIHSLDNSP
ncbi:MAG: hypothetical protein EA349_04805 [Halomonadaceae bacterium]|nr:MAG: hypothetical protein EA349_04805 [Halomonadaceae bacterium]